MKKLLVAFCALLIATGALADGVFVAPAPPGQFPGTATNDAATAGKVGEIAAAVASGTSATVTISNASPAVITWTGHPYTINSTGIIAAGVINFTTTGGLPTGLVVGTNYYAVPIDANTLHVATSVANALAGTFINTSSAGSGTHTGVATAILATTTIIDLGGMALTAGDWDCRGAIAISPSASPTYFQASLNTASITFPSAGSRGAAGAIGATLTGFQQMALGSQKYTFASTTNLFMNADAIFGTGTVAGFGESSCRRER